MKYGILTHIGFSKKGESNNRIISLGDVLECLAIRNIYQDIGISEKELIEVYPYEIDAYDGEYVILPINVYFLNMKNWSPRILPVFLGITVGGNSKMDAQTLSYFRRFSPVGCRDERTMRTLIENGIDAYLQGCLVATYPKRPKLPSQKKVFFTNPERGILDYIPRELLDNYEFVTHDYFTTSEELFHNGGIYKLGEQIVEKYRTEARLVVTSKYHSAILCLALGIPVIMVIENNYYKYTWIEKFIPIYEPKDYANIDWNPKIVCIPQVEKDLMLKIARDRILATFKKYHDICTLSEMRERPDISEFEDIFYGNHAIEFIKNKWTADTKIDYAFWGATDTARRLNAYISANCPKAHLVKIFDWSIRTPVEYAEGTYIPEPLDEISKPKNHDLFIFVTGNSASEAAMELFKKINKSPDKYVLCQRQELAQEDLG